jgi:guanosine-3',5'-bis(diphosphate) 3'-pyrophosphohydrolase
MSCKIIAGENYSNNDKTEEAIKMPENNREETKTENKPAVAESGYPALSGLYTILRTSGKKYDLKKIEDAYLYADMLHEGQYRQSGEPYISHPIAVAEIVASLGLDTDSICAAFLHDAIEDCSGKTDHAKIKERFGPEVEMLVDGLTKLVDIKIEDKEEAQMENIRKMLLAMSRDVRVIFIKLCDRLHNMRTLEAKKEDRRRQIALETMHVYAPLAHRLGMQRMKQELENLALQYLDPIGYAEVSADIERKYGQNQNFIASIKQYVNEKLTEYGMRFTLEGRVKTVYSIYRKMYNQNKSFDEIYDFYALRIIVDTELECYTALGIIHELFKSVPGRFKDYISTPKPNMYQSLHTTVIGRDGIPFEVQIRTREMHNIAEYGVAAHWKYKTGEKGNEDIDKKLAWISRLVETEDDALDPDDFLHAFKIDIFQDETFVFTPKGDVVVLPQGATIIDFAYAIHSEVGNKMIGAKINGLIAPIDSVPKNGEIVEILTSTGSKGPSRDWLNLVKTGEARNKIRQWFKREKRSENIEVGRDEVDREFSRFPRSCTEQQKNEIVTNVAHRLGMKEADDLYNTIGYGGIATGKIASKLRDEYDRVVKLDAAAPEIITAEQVKVTPVRYRNTGGIIVDGEPGCAVKYAKCCNPLPGDSVIGFITKGYGISIHKRDCPNVIKAMKSETNLDRFVNAEWDLEPGAQSKPLYEAGIIIIAENTVSLIVQITSLLADMKVSILEINTRRRTDRDIIIALTVACKDTSHLDSIVSRLRSLNHVIKVSRGI